MSELLYRKVGRRYVPAVSSELSYADNMSVGTWRMTYAYAETGRRYYYDVTPDTASFEAACMLARGEMERAIVEASIAHPNQPTRDYTADELKLIEKFRADMAASGAFVPTWWSHLSAHEIAAAGLAAVRNWKESK